jgi:magnesium chelatase family protein
VLFMDEFAEFTREVLESLRQPLEDRDVVVSRAKAQSRYLCQFMLVATANPCRCGYMADPSRACARAPLCGAEYMKNISGPMMDRFDLRVEMPPIAFYDLDLPANGDSSQQVAARIATAHQVQAERYRNKPILHNNAGLSGALLDTIATPDSVGQRILTHAAERFHLSAPGYHRVLRVARTVADLEGCKKIAKPHIA